MFNKEKKICSNTEWCSNKNRCIPLTGIDWRTIVPCTRSSTILVPTFFHPKNSLGLLLSYGLNSNNSSRRFVMIRLVMANTTRDPPINQRLYYHRIQRANKIILLEQLFVWITAVRFYLIRGGGGGGGGDDDESSILYIKMSYDRGVIELIKVLTKDTYCRNNQH